MTPLIHDPVTVQPLHVAVLDLLLTFLIFAIDLSVLRFELGVFKEKLFYEFLNGVAHNCRLSAHRKVLTLDVPEELGTRGTRG